MGIVFTPAAVMELLSSLPELEDYEISITEQGDNSIAIGIGESTYNIASSDAIEVEVPESVSDEVESISDEAYAGLEDSIDAELSDDVDIEGAGILRGLAKSIVLGGLIRLIPGLLK